MKIINFYSKKEVHLTGRWAIRNYGDGYYNLYVEVSEGSFFPRKVWVDSDDLIEVNVCHE